MSRKSLVPIVLPADPVAAMEAVTKQYVDARAGNEVTISPTDPRVADPGVELWYDPTATPAEQEAQEVFIGPDDPGSGYELWYDTDAPVTSPQGIRLFATMAERDAVLPAATAGNGSLCITLDKSRQWMSNGTIWKLIGGSFPRVRAMKMSAQTIQASVAVTWPEADVYDTDAIHDPAVNSSRMTIPAGLGGIWMFDFTCYLPAVAAGSEMFLAINGSTASARYGWAKGNTAAAEDMTLNGAAHIVLNAGDYVETYGYSGVSRQYGHASLASFFQASYLGAS